MIDLLLIAGSALCALSIVMAIIAVAQTQAPRSAAIALMMGILLLLLLGAKSDPAAVNPDNMMGAWKRLFAGEVSLALPEEAPAAEVPADTAPAATNDAAATPAAAQTTGSQ